MENANISIDVATLKAAHKRLSLMKGHTTHIATCDQDKEPNLTPIGSMRIKDDGEIHVIRGGLNKTFSNLKVNPKATFSFYWPTGLKSFFNMFSEKQSISGYRIYCDFVKTVTEESVVNSEIAQHLKLFYFFLRRPVKRYMEKNCRQVLVFKIRKVRPIVH